VVADIADLRAVVVAIGDGRYLVTPSTVHSIAVTAALNSAMCTARARSRHSSGQHRYMWGVSVAAT
jgi:hypothetical protein